MSAIRWRSPATRSCTDLPGMSDPSESFEVTEGVCTRGCQPGTPGRTRREMKSQESQDSRKRARSVDGRSRGGARTRKTGLLERGWERQIRMVADGTLEGDTREADILGNDKVGADVLEGGGLWTGNIGIA